MEKIEKETCIRFEDRRENQHQDLVSLIISTYFIYYIMWIITYYILYSEWRSYDMVQAYDNHS